VSDLQVLNPASERLLFYSGIFSGETARQLEEGLEEVLVVTDRAPVAFKRKGEHERREEQ